MWDPLGNEGESFSGLPLDFDGVDYDDEDL